MTARELERAGRILERKHRRAREAAGAAAVCAVLMAVTAPLSLTAGLACLAGAVAASTMALANVVSRRDLIRRLALDPHAHAIGAVRDYGLRLVSPAERQKLAAWLYEIVREATVPGNWYLADRVSQHSAQLELLASEFASSWLRIRPVSAAACLHLLTHGPDSPLYNPDIPAEELSTRIERIRMGITS
jgi:hypothetical protein